MPEGFLPMQGPWTVVPGMEYGEYWLREQHEGWEGVDAGMLADYDRHNAALMSKAPEFYQALADLLEWETNLGGFEAPVWARARQLLNALRGIEAEEDDAVPL